MWKKKLCTPLSTVLRRALPRFSASSTPQIQSSSVFTPSRAFTQQDSRVFESHIYHFLENLKRFSSESAEKVVVRCWNCNAVAETTPFLFCESCRTIQPVDHSVDYFQIFELEKKYEIQDENLEGKYKNWQKKLHPDLVHSKSEKEREYAAEQSARVIDAYRTLGKPLSRAIYIIMEIRESVEEAADSQALNQIQSQIQEKLKHWSKSFANAFQSRKYEEALTSIQRMTYYDRVIEEIVKKL